MAAFYDTSLLNKLDATGGPTVNDDTSAGYSVGSFWIDINNDVVYQCVDSTVGAAVWKTTSSASADVLTTIGSVMFEPTGFVNNGDGTIGSHSTIAFDNGTRTFTITPTGASFDYYIQGQKFTQVGAANVVINNIDGGHFIYFNNSGTLIADPSPPPDNLLYGVAYVAYVYWNVSAGKAIVVAEERHGVGMDYATHIYHHTTDGTVYNSGLGLGDFTIDQDGSLASHAQFSVSNGVVRDEDIKIDITDGSPQTLSPIANIPMFYREGASGIWNFDAPTTFAVKNFAAGTQRVAFNELTGGTWQQTEGGNNNYILSHIFATDDITYPIIAIQGIAEYGNLSAAREGATSEIASLSGFPFVEFIPIGTVIFQTSNSYSNTPHARIVSAASANYVDFRTAGLITGVAASDHGSLGGLADDDHTQYLTDARGDARYSLASINSPSFTTHIEQLNRIASPGVMSTLPSITDNGNGTIDIAGTDVSIRATNSDVAAVVISNVAAVTNLVMSDGNINYIYVEYNAGTPQYVTTTSKRTDNNTNILIAEIYRDGTLLHINPYVGKRFNNNIERISEEMLDTGFFSRVSGGIISGTGTRNIAITAGTWWTSTNKHTTNAFDSSAGGTFTYWYRDGVGGFNSVTSQSQIDNTQYDNGSGTLATLTNGRYGVHWVYLETDNHVHVLYGRGDYTLAQAQEANAPSNIPGNIIAQGTLVGKIIIQKSASTFQNVLSTFATPVSVTGVTSHLDLTDIGTNTHAQIDTHLAASAPHSGHALLAGSTGQAFSVANLQFPATQVASGNANTLDDYEEGTWTPTVRRSGTNPSFSGYSTRYGQYTKIGNAVFVRFYVFITSGNITDVGSGNWEVAGLPFTVNASSQAANLVAGNFMSNGVTGNAGAKNGSPPAWLPIGSATYMSVYHPKATETGAVAANIEFSGSGFYYV